MDLATLAVLAVLANVGLSAVGDALSVQDDPSLKSAGRSIKAAQKSVGDVAGRLTKFLV